MKHYQVRPNFFLKEQEKEIGGYWDFSFFSLSATKTALSQKIKKDLFFAKVEEANANVVAKREKESLDFAHDEVQGAKKFPPET